MPSSGGECSPGERGRASWGALAPAKAKSHSPGLCPHLWAPGRLSPEAGAMGVAGSPLRLTAPICWMWQGEKATPGLSSCLMWTGPAACCCMSWGGEGVRYTVQVAPGLRAWPKEGPVLQKQGQEVRPGILAQVRLGVWVGNWGSAQDQGSDSVQGSFRNQSSARTGAQSMIRT